MIVPIMTSDKARGCLTSNETAHSPTIKNQKGTPYTYFLSATTSLCPTQTDRNYRVRPMFSNKVPDSLTSVRTALKKIQGTPCVLHRGLYLGVSHVLGKLEKTPAPHSSCHHCSYHQIHQD